jgi:hypothetical protein
MNVALSNCKINICSTLIKLAIDLSLYITSRASKVRAREYKIEYSNKAFTIVTDCITNPSETPTVIWPAMKLPHRPYPVAVYLYAVALYLSGGITQREAARRVRQKFGLSRFSHSTLSRTFRQLLSRVENLEAVFGTHTSESAIPRRKQWSDSVYAVAGRLWAILSKLLAKSTLDDIMDVANQMAYQYFNQMNAQFIL